MTTSYPQSYAEKLHEILHTKRNRLLNQLSGTPEEVESVRDIQVRIEPIPSVDQLATLLDTAFFASVVQEEGRSATFSMLYVDPELAIQSSWPCVVFENPLPLTVEQIRKLSPATDPSEVDIGVYEFDGYIKVWGLVYARRIRPGERSLPMGLTISARQPASLIVRHGFEEVMMYSPGRVEFVDRESYLGSVGLRSLVSMAFSDTRDFEDRYRTASRIIDMACVALDGGHGATILVVPTGTEPKALDVPRYRLRDDSRRVLTQSLADPDRIGVSRALARAAFIDGALVLEETGSIIGIGAIIRTEVVPDFEVMVLNPTNPAGEPGRLTLSSFSGGARHRSALVFCYINPGSLALVVSHDGVMSVMTQPLKENGVAVLRPYQRGMDLAI